MSAFSHLRLACRRLRYALTGNKGGSDKYRDATIASPDIDTKTYQSLLGGGSEKWEERGLFQLHFLKEQGLKPEHRLLDIGCGPIRAGQHLIKYLDNGNYYGVDYNAPFIKIAKELIAESELQAKNPTVEVVDDFAFPESFPTFDYLMVFSVLNHCTEAQKKAFFDNIDRITAPNALVCISHAGWFLDAYLAQTGLTCIAKLHRQDLDLEKWGWTDMDQKRTFPILILRRS